MKEKDDSSNIALIVSNSKLTNSIHLLNSSPQTTASSYTNNNNNNSSPTSSVSILPEGWTQNTLYKTTDSQNKSTYTFRSMKSPYETIYTSSKTGMFNYIINDSKQQKVATISSSLLSNNFTVCDIDKNPLMKVKYSLNMFGLFGQIKFEVNIMKYIDVNKDIGNIPCDFINKEPEYSPIYKSYYLKFIGRTIKSSVKNFQLIDKGSPKKSTDNIYYQFALLQSDEVFVCDFKEPFTNLLGFALGVIALSSKMFCEQINE
jgi:hypothetical protein